MPSPSRQWTDTRVWPRRLWLSVLLNSLRHYSFPAFLYLTHTARVNGRESIIPTNRTRPVPATLALQAVGMFNIDFQFVSIASAKSDLGHNKNRSQLFFIARKQLISVAAGSERHFRLKRRANDLIVAFLFERFLHDRSYFEQSFPCQQQIRIRACCLRLRKLGNVHRRLTLPRKAFPNLVRREYKYRGKQPREAIDYVVQRRLRASPPKRLRR